MNAFRRIAIVDIGKTNAKVVVLDSATGLEIATAKTANRVLSDGPYPHYDIDRLWAFVLDALRKFSADPGFDTISITTHGACAALLDADGKLALPVLDYEHNYPVEVQEAYAAIRPPFSETSSPPLTAGLNLGAQLHYQQMMFPEAFGRVASILTYPQYWAFRLTAVLANEETSLGCHTDLWQPATRRYSSLVERLGIGSLMAPVRSAFDRLAPLRPEIASLTKIAAPVPVFCGIHDSNASLLPHLIGRQGPFSVVSTGTWVVGFAVGANLAGLDPARDTLANVDAYGRAVPSCRFMGGREYAMLTEGWSTPSAEEVAAAVPSMLDQYRMYLPGFAHGSGPFPERAGERLGPKPETAAEAHAMAAAYAALMTDACLRMIGASGETIVEGPLADNTVFLQLFAGLIGRDVLAISGSTGTSAGAALLTGTLLPAPLIQKVVPWPRRSLEPYRHAWLQRLGMVAMA